MLSSFYMFDILSDYEQSDISDIFSTNGFHILAISKVILEKYVHLRHADSVGLAKYIYKAHQKGDLTVLRQCIMYAAGLMADEIETTGNGGKEKIFNLMTKRFHFEMLMEKTAKKPINVSDIESIVLEDQTRFRGV